MYVEIINHWRKDKSFMDPIIYCQSFLFFRLIFTHFRGWYWTTIWEALGQWKSLRPRWGHFGNARAIFVYYIIYTDKKITLLLSAAYNRANIRPVLIGTVQFFSWFAFIIRKIIQFVLFWPVHWWTKKWFFLIYLHLKTSYK